MAIMNTPVLGLENNKKVGTYQDYREIDIAVWHEGVEYPDIPVEVYLLDRYAEPDEYDKLWDVFVIHGYGKIMEDVEHANDDSLLLQYGEWIALSEEELERAINQFSEGAERPSRVTYQVNGR